MLHFIGDCNVEVENYKLKLQPPGFMYFSLMAQISAAQVERVKMCIHYFRNVPVIIIKRKVKKFSPPIIPADIGLKTAI